MREPLMLRRIANVLSIPVIWLMMPVKLLAFRYRHRVFGRVLLELTCLGDFMLVLANVQNAALRLHHRIYRGAFPFGKSVMVVDHAKALREIAQPSLRGNRFMGLDLVSNDPGVFVTNAGPISTGQPTRRLIRDYIDHQIMTPRVRALDYGALRTECAEILRDWTANPKMATMLSIRGTLTRLFIRVLAEKTLSKAEADDVTWHYFRRFAEFSLFGRYFPAMLGVLGTREAIRRGAYIPLRKLGVDNLAIDMTLFAAMFSVGTIVIKCVEFARQHDIDYGALSPFQRFAFVIESFRICPTVTTVHRIVEADETVDIRGRRHALRAGDEVAYPFVCINQDRKVFSDPEAFRIDRPAAEAAQVLSWSAGPHVCPAKDLSIVSSVLMLDTLASARGDLRRLKIFNLEF
jgi:hypothetical protein